MNVRRLPCCGKSFPSRLIALTVGVNLFAMVLAALALENSYGHQRQTAETVSQNLAQVLEQSITATVARADDALMAVADEYRRQDRQGLRDEASILELMERHSTRTPGIVGLRTADADGVVRHIVGGPRNGIAMIADRDYFTRLRPPGTSGPVISEPIFGRITNQWIIVLARRLEHADGSFAGVVFAPLALNHVSDTFAALNLGPHGAVSLRDSSLTVIARYPDTLTTGESAIGSREASRELLDMVAHAQNAGTFLASSAIDNVPRTASYRRLTNYPLYVVVGLAVEDYLEDWWAELGRTTVLLTVFLGLSIWGARWMLRSWRDEESALARASQATTRLEAVLGSAPIGLAIVDQNRRIQEANAALAAIFGVASDGLHGATTQALYASEEEFLALGVRAYPTVRSGRTYSETISMCRRDGSRFWCKLNGRQIDPQRPELGNVWIFEDITEQITTTQALRDSEERFRVLVDGVRDYAILRLDADGVVRTWNQGARALKGYEADEIIGQSFTCFFPPEDVLDGVPERALEQARRLGRHEMEGWRQRKDGSRFWAHTLLTVLHGGSDFAEITRDITEQRRAAEEIRRLASYQKAILDNTPVGIAILSLDRTIMQANEAFCAIFGRGGEDLSGQPAAILYSDPDQSRDVKDRAYPLVTAGGTFADDVLMSRRDGGSVWVRLVAHLVDAAHPELGIVWTAQDISALKDLNESLLRSNAELERFAYVASHDLRQPLRMISSYMGLVERRLNKDGHLDDEMREFLGYAIDGAQRMDRMIIDMLDYSRIGRQSSPIEELPLQAPLDRALGNLAAAITESSAEIAVPTPLPQVVGSASELERLFQNLIGNALKFRAEGRPPRVEIRCEENTAEWLISVTDNGIGIDPAQSDRLFALFSRLVSPQQYEGSGIGLAACRKIAEHHGGRIWVEPAVGGGSVFRVALARRRS